MDISFIGFTYMASFVLRNTFSIEITYYFELRNYTLSSDMATYEVTSSGGSQVEGDPREPWIPPFDQTKY